MTLADLTHRLASGFCDKFPKIGKIIGQSFYMQHHNRIQRDGRDQWTVNHQWIAGSWLLTCLITATLALAGCTLWDSADTQSGKITASDDESGGLPSLSQPGDDEIPGPHELNPGIPEVGADDISRICGSDGWCWDTPWPQGNSLRAVWGSGPNTVFAVGSEGTILRFDGERWTLMNSADPDRVEPADQRSADVEKQCGRYARPRPDRCHAGFASAQKRQKAGQDQAGHV